MKMPSSTWYQEAMIRGVKMPHRRLNDTSELRWKTLIEPLLPYQNGEGRLFVELGSNAGFYLRKAVDHGFKTIGVEKSIEFVSQARYWEKNEPKGVKTIHGDLNNYDVPVCHILLLAQVHYWIRSEEIKKLVRKIKNRAMHVIVVGRYKRLRQHQSPCKPEPLKEYFKGWVQGGLTKNKIRKHYGTIFNNPRLVEVGIDELVFYPAPMKLKRLLPPYRFLVKKVLSGNDYCVKPSDPYYKYLEWRNCRDIPLRIKKKINLIKSVAKDGIRKPLLIGRFVNGKWNNNCLYDGDSRYIIAKELGFKRLICRKRRKNR